MLTWLGNKFPVSFNQRALIHSRAVRSPRNACSRGQILTSADVDFPFVGQFIKTSGMLIIPHLRPVTPTHICCCSRMVSPLSILWTFLSVMVACVCCFSFAQPFWYVHRDNSYTLGMFSYCERHSDHEIYWRLCQTYSGTFQLYDVGTGAWQAACVLYGGGCALLVVSSLLSASTLCIKVQVGDKLVMVASYIQIVSVVLMCASLVIFPFGLGSPFVRNLCGPTSAYYGSDCRLGWSYMLGIVGTSLSVFCPVFSHLTDPEEPQTQSGSRSVSASVISQNNQRSLSRSFSIYKYPPEQDL